MYTDGDLVMNQIIYSCPLLPGNRVINKSISSEVDTNRFHILIATQFALPFGKHKSSKERYDWFEMRLNLFRKTTQISVESQHWGNSDVEITWLVFITKGDRKKFNLPKYEVLNGNIIMNWVEVEKKEGMDDDYYRNNVMPSEIQKYIDSMNRNLKEKEYTLTIRLDSDDVISKLFIRLILRVSHEIYKMGKLEDIYLYYPCGLTYNSKSEQICPRIWPESSFMACIEKTKKQLKTVWHRPHDAVSHSEKLIPIITNKPMWMTLVGHGNMVNSMGEYLSNLEDLDYPLVSPGWDIKN